MATLQIPHRERKLSATIPGDGDLNTPWFLTVKNCHAITTLVKDNTPQSIFTAGNGTVRIELNAHRDCCTSDNGSLASTHPGSSTHHSHDHDASPVLWKVEI